MRFEDRLRTSFRISHEAADARCSLLLHAFVENAIKYAVSPQEEGPRLSIAANMSATACASW
jgi:LytS/YehU family sensor histidine kinase